MRVLLRNEETGLFYAGHQRWIPDSGRALDFKSVEQAQALSREAHAEVFLSYENPGLRSRFLRRSSLANCRKKNFATSPVLGNVRIAVTGQ